MSLRKIAKDLIVSIDKDAAKRGYVPCSELKVGKKYIYSPGHGKKPRLVKIIDGQYWGDYGRSNFWTWRYVNRDGSLGKEESGYGGCFRPTKK